MRFILPEIERGRQFAAGVYELDAVLLDEVAGLHLVQHVEPLEDPVGLRNQRFADVKSGETLALEQVDLDAVLGQQRGDGGSRWTAANHYDLGCSRRLHNSRFLSLNAKRLALLFNESNMMRDVPCD